jgi:DnaJ-class molecular chaperone
MHTKSNETVECGKCGGSGVYYGHGRVENGTFVGFTGPCYACQGKGRQTPVDQRRNWGYWKHNAPRM